MSRLIEQFTTREGSHVTIIDHTKPHSKENEYEIILQAAPLRPPIELRTEEWEHE